MKTIAKITSTALACALTAAAVSCTGKSASAPLTKSGLDPEKFAMERDGKPVALYTLTNPSGMEACITNFGGRLVSLMVPDAKGGMRDVVVGFDSIADYLPENHTSDFGASIGRYANRIGHGILALDGDTIQLPTNNFGHTLHGGPDGWQYKVYDAEQPNDSTLVLKITSPDGDNSFPGTVNATVTYTLRADNALDIAYEATTDRPTVINMTNHSYFNLSGDFSKPVNDHVLMIAAASYTPTDTTYMTTGEIAPVADTPMDFTSPKAVGTDIDNFEFAQIRGANGFDHNWVLDAAGCVDSVAIVLSEPESGIVMEVLTSEPGVQFYSGNFLDGTLTGKGGRTIAPRGGLCLETQHYPDSPNKPEWPSVRLDPGQTYTSRCIYRFSTAAE